jgi:DNA-binding CsgD family transcriptional regulator
MPNRAFEPGQTSEKVEAAPAFAFKPIEPLNERELEVLRYTAQGRTAAEVAGALFLAQRTVKGYLADARLKLGARNAPHAVALAIGYGFIHIDTVMVN